MSAKLEAFDAERSQWLDERYVLGHETYRGEPVVEFYCTDDSWYQWLTPATARDLAARLIAMADEVDKS